MVYDITKADSFNDLEKWLNDIAENANKHLSVVLMGNKTDMETRYLTFYFLNVQDLFLTEVEK